MAFRKVINPFLILILIFVKCTVGVIEVNVSKLSVNFGSQINNFVTNCFGVDIDFYLQVATSNFSQISPYFVAQEDATQYSVALTGSSAFTMTSTTDFIAVTGILSMRCSNGQNASDTFLLQSQSSYQNDRNNQDVPIQVTSNKNQWTLTATINRKCTGASEYGFNCNEQCSTNDQYYCYQCGSYGQKTCCQNANVNPNDCTYYDHPLTSTWSPNSQCSSSAENTYFWLMISFAIIIAILAILLLLVFLELCCGLFTGRTAKGSEDGDWIVPKEPKANRELYDGDINRHHEYRRRQENSRDSTEPDERDRRSPYIVSRQGMENHSYDDEVLRNEFQEAQPRRIARV